MTFLDDFYDESCSLIEFPANDELVRKWEKLGLLFGLIESEKSVLAFYFEVLLNFLRRNPSVGERWKTNHDQESDVEICLFPMIRRLFSGGQLNPTVFGCKTNEEINYQQELIQYLQTPDNETIEEFRMDKIFVEFVPKMIEDYFKWLESPSTLDTRITLAHSDDPDAYLLKWYCETFDLKRFIH